MKKRLSRKARAAPCVGLNKGTHDGSICVLPPGGRVGSAEIFLKERMTRVKRDGGDVTAILQKVAGRIAPGAWVAENSFKCRPGETERELDARVPYFEYIKWHRLERFVTRFNPELRFFPHHYCHALAASALSPFSRALIVVVDGGGNGPNDFDSDDPELHVRPLVSPPKGSLRGESCTVYTKDGADLRCVHKEWGVYKVRRFGRDFIMHGDSLGKLYELAALYVFNSIDDAGKVMGLAPFGRPSPVADRRNFHRTLDWKRRFRGRGKRAWEASGEFSHYADVAAAVQGHFEDSLLNLLGRLRRRFPEYRNLILTGGCALNCVANMKIVETGWFRRVYVPPFPGDESIAFGAAQGLRLRTLGLPWRGVGWSRQIPNFGPVGSAPERKRVREVFAPWRVRVLDDPARETARLLRKGKILGWFQGRSESGPRALGFRSILADPSMRGVKNLLNEKVKCRESFRPYGCSTLWEKSHRYFAVAPGFDSPFMSFSPKVLDAMLPRLREVTHVDGTSRIQTVRATQNPLFYRLIRAFGDISGVHCILNTSLNVMGEPIVETLDDLRRFFERTPVDGVVAGDCLIDRG